MCIRDRLEQPCAAQHDGNGLHQRLFQAQALQEGDCAIAKGDIVLGFVLDIRFIQYKQLLRDLVDGVFQLVHHGLCFGQTRLSGIQLPEDVYKRQRDARKNGGARSNSGERQMFDAVCAACGKTCKVPFQPREDRPVYCSDCFARMKQN